MHTNIPIYINDMHIFPLQLMIKARLQPIFSRDVESPDFRIHIFSPQNVKMKKWWYIHPHGWLIFMVMQVNIPYMDGMGSTLEWHPFLIMRDAIRSLLVRFFGWKGFKEWDSRSAGGIALQLTNVAGWNIPMFNRSISSKVPCPLQKHWPLELSHSDPLSSKISLPWQAVLSCAKRKTAQQGWVQWILPGLRLHPEAFT